MIFNFLYRMIYGDEEEYILNDELIELIPSLTPLSMVKLPEDKYV